MSAGLLDKFCHYFYKNSRDNFFPRWTYFFCGGTPETRHNCQLFSSQSTKKKDEAIKIELYCTLNQYQIGLTTAQNQTKFIFIFQSIGSLAMMARSVSDEIQEQVMNDLRDQSLPPPAKSDDRYN